MPKSLARIEDETFANSGLVSLEVPLKVRKIGRRAFSGCASLREVRFAEGARLEEIRAGAFQRAGLERFRAPPRLRRIGPEAFCACERLREVVLNEGLAFLGVSSGDVREFEEFVKTEEFVESKRFGSSEGTREPVESRK